MAIQNKTTYQSNVDSLITTNGVGDISGADVNTVLDNLSDSVIHTGSLTALGLDPTQWDVNNFGKKEASCTASTNLSIEIINTENQGEYYLRIVDLPANKTTITIDGTTDGTTAVYSSGNNSGLTLYGDATDEVLVFIKRINLNLFVSQVGLEVFDDDDLSSNSARGVPTVQSVKAYADTKLSKSSNLSDLGSTSTARTNLDVYSKAEIGSSVSINNYSPDKTGVLDSSAAFNSALASSFDNIIIEKGTYLFDDSVVIPIGKTLLFRPGVIINLSNSFNDSNILTFGNKRRISAFWVTSDNTNIIFNDTIINGNQDNLEQDAGMLDTYCNAIIVYQANGFVLSGKVEGQKVHNTLLMFESDNSDIDKVYYGNAPTTTTRKNASIDYQTCTNSKFNIAHNVGGEECVDFNSLNYYIQGNFVYGESCVQSCIEINNSQHITINNVLSKECRSPMIIEDYNSIAEDNKNINLPNVLHIYNGGDITDGLVEIKDGDNINIGLKVELLDDQPQSTDRIMVIGNALKNGVKNLKVDLTVIGDNIAARGGLVQISDGDNVTMNIHSTCSIGSGKDLVEVDKTTSGVVTLNINAINSNVNSPRGRALNVTNSTPIVNINDYYSEGFADADVVTENTTFKKISVIPEDSLTLLDRLNSNGSEMSITEKVYFKAEDAFTTTQAINAYTMSNGQVVNIKCTTVFIDSAGDVGGCIITNHVWKKNSSGTVSQIGSDTTISSNEDLTGAPTVTSSNSTDTIQINISKGIGGNNITFNIKMELSLSSINA